MSDTLTTKKVTELSENTDVSDNDLFMAGSAGTASLRKIKWSTIWNKIKTKILSNLVVNNLTATEEGYMLDARQGKELDDKISELNTKIKQGGVRLIQWNQINTSTINYTDYNNALKIFWVNGWDANMLPLTPQSSTDFWVVLHIPCYVGSNDPSTNDMSCIKQIWMSMASNAVYTRSYTNNTGWSSFSQK